jgi:hypothetical protein
MFFGLEAIDDHPCCKMQEVVEEFFKNSIREESFSLNLFPEWMRATLRKKNCALNEKFSVVHALLHGRKMDSQARRDIYNQLQLTNRIQDLCNGIVKLPKNHIVWDSDLGKAISALMLTLYESLDLSVFKRNGQAGKPTHQMYNEFIQKNKYVCPFCGLDKFITRGGPRRQDFDHYLNKSAYPLAAANMRNLIPTCGSCNQDYKKVKDILEDGLAFYPYCSIPEVTVQVICKKYPLTTDLDDKGKWSVNVELAIPDKATLPKMTAWERVYSIKTRLEMEIREYFEEWMTEVSDDCPHEVDEEQFAGLIKSAKIKAQQSAKRRMEPKQIVKGAFYEFVLTKARSTFVESFRRLRNEQYGST